MKYLFIVFLFFTACNEFSDASNWQTHTQKTDYKFPSNVEWRSCVGYVNGQPRFFDSGRIDVPYLFATKSHINNTRSQRIKSSKIILTCNYWMVYDTPKSDPYNEHKYSVYRRKYYIKHNKQGTLVSDDKKYWDKLNIKLGKDKKTGNLIITLNCKWFSGEYEFGDTPG